VVRIAEIQADSIAEELELRIGTRIVRVNGQKVRDGIDLTFLLGEPILEMETVDPDGARALYEIERDPSAALGIIPAPDTVRECANECVFCFIDGNPKGVRDTLWIRDDDFRLSFTYGSYVTLTNLGPRGLDRLVEQRLSPLYVSVHTTDPELRERLLKNRRAGLIMDQLTHLLEHGLEVHTQVVLCPEWNDGAHLDRTIQDLYSLGAGIRSLSVVPVGLTRYNLNRPVRPLTAGEAAQAVDQVETAGRQARVERGYGWVYPGDELLLQAGRPLPDIDYYDDTALIENGVGALRVFLDDMDAGIEHGLPDLGGLDVRILTGASMAPFFEERVPTLSSATGAKVGVTIVPNRFFGETVTTAGLLAGNDLLASALALERPDVFLIPAETLNQDHLFIDSLAFDDFCRALAPARVIPAYELTDALRAL
jgi:putative radical SAM enzyme (TIGR03279 family)